VYDEICFAADGGMRARVRVLRGGYPVSAFKTAAQIAAGASGPLIGMAVAGPVGAIVGAALAYGIAKVTPGLGRPSREERELFAEAARLERNR
jgi:hypothetical protein